MVTSVLYIRLLNDTIGLFLSFITLVRLLFLLIGRKVENSDLR